MTAVGVRGRCAFACLPHNRTTFIVGKVNKPSSLISLNALKATRLRFYGDRDPLELPLAFNHPKM